MLILDLLIIPFCLLYLTILQIANKFINNLFYISVFAGKLVYLSNFTPTDKKIKIQFGSTKNMSIGK